MQKINSILLIDDDDTTNFLNKRLFQKMDIADELQVARNGRDALEYIEKYCHPLPGEGPRIPKLILLDINMPVMNGFGFLSAFEQLECEGKEEVIIVVLTTSLNPKDVTAIQQSGVKDFINKPLTREMVTTLVQKHFN